MPPTPYPPIHFPHLIQNWSLNLKQVLSLPCLKYLEDSSCDVNAVKFAMTYTALQGWAASFPQSHLIQWSTHSALLSALESSPQKLCRCFLQPTRSWSSSHVWFLSILHAYTQVHHFIQVRSCLLIVSITVLLVFPSLFLSSCCYFICIFLSFCP